MVVHEGITPSSRQADGASAICSKLMDQDLYKYIADHKVVETLTDERQSPIITV